MFVGIFHDLSDDDLGIGWNTYYVREKLIAILDQDDVQLLNCTGSSTDAVSLWLKHFKRAQDESISILRMLLVVKNVEL